MHVLGRIVSNVRHFYNEINPATLSGAVDVIVIQQADGTYRSTPFHVKFGILEVMRAKNKEVDVYLNDELIDLRMELGENGDAYFVSTAGPCNCHECKYSKQPDSPELSEPPQLQDTLSVSHEIRPLSDSEAVLTQDPNHSNYPLSDNESTKYYVASMAEDRADPIMMTTYSPTSFDFVKRSDEPSPVKKLSSNETSMLPHPALTDFEIELSLCGGLVSTSRKPGNGQSNIKENFDKHTVSFADFIGDPSILNRHNLVVRINKSYFNWAIASPIIVSYLAFNAFLPHDTLIKLKRDHLPKKKRSWFYWRRYYEPDSSDEDKLENTKPLLENTTAIPIGESKFGIMRKSASFGTSKTSEPNVIKQSASEFSVGRKIQPCYRRSKVLSSEVLKQLPLNVGSNSVTFSVTTRYQGTVTCGARIFLWSYRDRIVISDVDGTITKSDVLGMIMPLVGRDWTQEGVVKLFTLIHNNGYKIVYLSARTYGIANQTRNYLENIIMDRLKLPLGPILLSPTSLFEALHREVVEKKPEIFKIDCLQTVSNLFPFNSNPLVAGFGNRINDSRAYLEVGVPKTKIFIINSKGQITQEHNKAYLSSYSTMAEFVDLIFPLIDHNSSCDFHINEYNDFHYWKRSTICK